MKKKKSNWFLNILGICFIIFVALYIAQASGYYEAKIAKRSVITSEAIKEFENDVSLGKEIDIKDYVSSDYVDYSSPMADLGSKLGSGIDKIMDGGITDFFKFLGNLF